MAVSKLPSGKWRVYVRYRDALGRPQQKKKEGFKTRREALAWERSFMVSAGQSVPGLTFGELAQRYLDDMGPTWKPGTVTRAKHATKKNVAFFGKMKVGEIGKAEIHAFHRELLGKPGATSTKKLQCCYLRQVFSYGIRYCGLASDPMAGMRLDFGPAKQSGMRGIWTKEQFAKFMEAAPKASGKDEMWRIYFMILFWSGCRRGEALALTVEDIDFAANSIRINKNKTEVGIGTPKTQSSIRVVAMPRAIMGQIKDYLARIYNPNPAMPLFPIGSSAAGRAWRKWVREYALPLGLPEIRLHDLRHSHASMLIDLGFSPQAVGDRLGHSNAQMVLKVYGHLYKQKRREIADKLDELLKTE